MKLLFITDIHNKIDHIPFLPKADLLVLGGDLTHFGTTDDLKKIINSFQNIYPEIFVVLGNCDPKAGEETLQKMNIDLNLRHRNWHGINFYGISGSNPTPAKTPYEWQESELKRSLYDLNQPDKRAILSILVSHTPPFGSGAGLLDNDKDVGCRSINEFVNYLQTQIILCGHIHEGQGIFSWRNCKVVNPGAFKDGYFAMIDFTRLLNPEISIKKIEQ